MTSSTPKVVSKIYQVGDQLGKGAFGKVYRGLNVKTGEFVAIKQMEKILVNKEQMESITVELDLLQKLYHPNIVRFIEYEDTGLHLYFIMEFVEGGSLHEAMRKFGVFPESLLILYMAQVLKGLHYLHEQGVIHRDIKGANILLTKEGSCKLADFGSCAYVVNQNNGMVGTPFWMAPEIIAGSTASIKSDIWSVGCSIIELVAGNPPYWNAGRSVALYRMVEDIHPPYPSSLSPELEDLLNLCFIRDVDKRPLATDLLNHKIFRSAEPEANPVQTKPGPNPQTTTTKKGATMRISSLFSRSPIPQSLTQQPTSSSASSSPATSVNPSPTITPSSSLNNTTKARAKKESGSGGLHSSSPTMASSLLGVSTKEESDSSETGVTLTSSSPSPSSGSSLSYLSSLDSVEESFLKQVDSVQNQPASTSSSSNAVKRLAYNSNNLSHKDKVSAQPLSPTSMSGFQNTPSTNCLVASSSLIGGFAGLSTPSLPHNTSLDDSYSSSSSQTMAASAARKHAYEAAVTAGYCETIKTLEAYLHSTRNANKLLSKAAWTSKSELKTLKDKALNIKELTGQQFVGKKPSGLDDLECVINLLNMGQSRIDNLLLDLNLPQPTELTTEETR